MNRKSKQEKRKPGFHSLKQIIEERFNNLSTENRFSSSASLQKCWETLVGPAVAQHSKVLFVKQGVAHVAVESSTWLNELQFMKDSLVMKIRAGLPQLEIKDIRLKIQSKSS